MAVDGRHADRLIHDYFCVDYELVRDVVRNRIPELRGQLAAVLEASQAAAPDERGVGRFGVRSSVQTELGIRPLAAERHLFGRTAVDESVSSARICEAWCE
jgi:hypothetical protein